MRQKSYLITLFILVPFFCLGQWAQQLNFQNSLTDQGIINSTVYHSYQGPKGFIWFATESGVLQFDGTEYKHFTVDDGLSDNEVLKIHPDSKNRIWFLTLSGKLSYYLNGKFYNAGNDELIRKTSINSAFTSFYEDKQHNLWFLALDNICIKISPQNKVTRLNLGNKLQGRECFFYEDARDGLMIVSRNGFYRVAGDKQTLIKYPYTLSKSKCYAYTANGGIIFLADEGIVHMQGAQQELIIPARYLPANAQLGYLFLDKHNNLWINTLGTGTYFFADFFSKPQTHKQYLPGSIITGALHDNEDNLWFTTIGEGTYMLPANYLKVVSLTAAQGLSSNKIYSVTKDSDNNIWLGMDKGIINVLKPNSIAKIDANYQQEIYNRVNHLMEDKARNIWGATDKGTILFLKNKNYKKEVIKSSMGYDYPTKVVGQAADKDIYYVYSSGIQKIKQESLKQENYQSEPLPNFPKVRTFTHFLDQDDSTLWFANVRGLHSYKNNQVTSYARLDTLLTQRITHIAQTPDKLLVLATHGYGIILFKNNKIIRRITRQHGLPDNICKKVFVKDSIIWVATNNGICRINYKSNRKPDILTVSDGIISNEINDIYVDAEKIYIATPLGLSILNNSNNLKRIASKPPMVQISQVSTKTKTLNVNRKVNLSYDDNQLFIKFAAITFQDPKNIIYQYRLKDDKAGWVETKNNYVDYSSLSTGNHVFEVKAKKVNSDWSQIASFRFTITPPYWHTWWFVGLVLCFLTLFVVALVRYVTAFQYRQQLRKMETEQRLQHERERIARDLHDNVGSQLAYIINSLDDTPATNEVLTSTKTNHLREFTKQTINQLRETIWAIRQENISIGELVTKVQKLIWQLTRYKSNFKHEIKVDGDQDIKLSPLQALNLYRIVQEAINNVFNHSLADTIKITFNVNAPKSLDITIADNGIGFDTGSTHLDSYGLLNMQERANEIPAQFSIISAKGKGTRIKLKVDL